MTPDPTPDPAYGTAPEAAEPAPVNRLFDLRYLIGSLFTFYGLLLTVASFFVSTAKSGGININLWLGLGMLVLGVFFLGWARLRPLVVEDKPSVAAQGRGSPQE
jgi:hypothetical protein